MVRLEIARQDILTGGAKDARMSEHSVMVALWALGNPYIGVQMKRKRDAAKEVDKQIQRVSASVQEYRDAVNEVAESPGKAAVRKKDKFRINLLAAIDSGKWEEATGNIDLEDWKKRTSGKGADRLVAGLEDSRDKSVDFRQQLIAYQEQVSAKIDAMPDTTPEQREARLLANMREMRKFKRSRRRR